MKCHCVKDINVLKFDSIGEDISNIIGRRSLQYPLYVPKRSSLREDFKKHGFGTSIPIFTKYCECRIRILSDNPYTRKMKTHPKILDRVNYVCNRFKVIDVWLG